MSEDNVLGYFGATEEYAPDEMNRWGVILSAAQAAGLSPKELCYVIRQVEPTPHALLRALDGFKSVRRAIQASREDDAS